MQEIEITEAMLVFRKAIMNSWNMYFPKDDFSKGLAAQSAYSSIEQGFFEVIILLPNDRTESPETYRSEPLDWIVVKIKPCLSLAKVQFGEKKADGNFYWDEVTELEMDQNLTFDFFDFFDWNAFGNLELPYVRVRGSHVKGQEKYAGRLALLPVADCSFFLSSSR